jgi:hypothetical protein
MASNVIIEHKDGRRYSTTTAGFNKLYKDQGFKIVGREDDSAFVVIGVPAPKAARKAPKAKTAKRRIPAARPLAAVATPKPSEVISPPADPA